MSQTLDVLEKLIGFNSVSANSNLGIIGYIGDYLRARGFKVVEIPDEAGQKAGLYASVGPAGDGVLLSGHTDVVPAEGQVWTRDPFRMTREDGRVYGRGTTDMKGYLASVMALADRAAAADLKEPLKIAFSYDEEIGCVGIKKMLSRLSEEMGRPRACFVGEPTEMQVAIGHKGKAALRAICHGENGHSALAPQFVNALHLAADFLGGLRAIQDDLAAHGHRDSAYGVPYTTVHAGVLQGGTALNIVPDRAELTFEYRHLAADPAQEILRRIEKTADQVGQRYQERFAGARVEVEQYNDYPGLDVAESDPVVPYAQKLAQTNAVTKVAFGTEAGYFHGLGIPTVVCGPGSMEGQGHKPDEFVTLAQLEACDAMMDRILADLSG